MDEHCKPACPDTRVPIDVENYPDIDPDTDDGKDELSSLAFELALGRTPIHFVFRRRGEEIGQMIVRAPLVDLPQ
jgi:hypothetical protein